MKLKDIRKKEYSKRVFILDQVIDQNTGHYFFFEQLHRPLGFDIGMQFGDQIRERVSLMDYNHVNQILRQASSSINLEIHRFINSEKN